METKSYKSLWKAGISPSCPQSDTHIVLTVVRLVTIQLRQTYSGLLMTQIWSIDGCLPAPHGHMIEFWELSNWPAFTTHLPYPAVTWPQFTTENQHLFPGSSKNGLLRTTDLLKMTTAKRSLSQTWLCGDLLSTGITYCTTLILGSFLVINWRLLV